MLVSSTSMNAAMATTTAISQGLTWGRQGSAAETGDNSIGGSLSAIFAVLIIALEDGLWPVSVNLVLHFGITVTYGKNHKDTKKGRINELFLAAFLCVFVSLWFLIMSPYLRTPVLSEL